MTDGVDLDTIGGFAVAVGIGLLIGAERERRKSEGPARSAAGIRTFALVALVGASAAALGGNAIIVAGCLFVAGAALVSYVVGDRTDPGLTTEVALVLTYLLAVLAERDPTSASGVAVAVTALLASRSALHRLVRELMTPEELQDLLVLSSAALVVLPLVPDRAYGPAGTLNPFKVWQFAVLVMGVGGLGHVVTRLMNPRFGLPMAGLAGGFISSSATIGSMGATARRVPSLTAAAVAGALFSTIATFLQLGIILAAGSPPALREVAFPLACGGAVAVVGGVVAAFAGSSDGGERVTGARAFSLQSALLFAGLVAGMLVIGALAHDAFGSGGVAVAAALGGLADTHAAAAAVAGLVGRGELTPEAAVTPLLLALTTNTVTKAIVARVAGDWAYAGPVWMVLMLVLAAAWAAVLARSLVSG